MFPNKSSRYLRDKVVKGGRVEELVEQLLISEGTGEHADDSVIVLDDTVDGDETDGGDDA